MTAPYNMSFACLECRKAFKRHVDIKNIPAQLACPQCGGPAHNFGRHFKSPRQVDARQWQKVRFLFEHGFRFQKIRIGSGHHETVTYPETLEEAKEFVVKYKEHACSPEHENKTHNNAFKADVAKATRP